MRTADRKMLYIIDKFKAAHPEMEDHVDPHLVAPWAIAEGLFDRPPTSQEETLRRELSKALKNEHTVDPQGREVRKNHAVFFEEVTPRGPKRRSRWYTIDDAPPDHMRASCQLRRRAALADVVQLKLDFDSYNDNNRFGATLPDFDYDFNKDIEEMGMPTKYPSDSPDDDQEVA